jgi:LPS-assembly protein
MGVGFILILLSMTTLIWLTQSLKMLDMIVTKGASVGIFLKMTFLVLPNFIQILSPLSLFAVALIIFTRMQSDKELIVMQSIGMSNGQIMKAPLFLTLFMVAVGYLLTLVFIPQSNTDLREMKWKVRNNLSHILLQEGQFNSFKDGLTIYIKERQSEGVIKGIVAYDAKDPAKIATLIAQSGTISGQDDALKVVFQDGTRNEFNPATKQFSILKFDKYTMLFNDDADGAKGRTMDVRELSLTHLLKATPEDAQTPTQWRKYKVEATKRLIQPLYGLTFIFLAMYGVLAGAYNRRGQMGRVNFVIVAAIVVQSLALAFENLSNKNLIFLPMMVLNVLVPIILVYFALFKKASRTGIAKAAVFLIAAVFAFKAHAIPNVDVSGLDKEKPVDFEADTISYDQKNDILTAEGDVIIEQKGTVLKTSKIIFDRRKNMITAPSPVMITMPDGTVSRSEKMTLSPDMKKAVGDAIQMRFYDGTFITASHMDRSHEGKIMDLEDVTYTPCDTCDGKNALWQIRAKDMRHDVDEKTFIYKHSFLDIQDVPVFYFPYLRVPDHTVKRKTGFLAPALSHGREMKGGIQLPFFANIADNQNLIITPIISTSHFPLGILDYNGVFDKAILNMQLSGTVDNDDHAKQGHIKGNFVYDLTDEWRVKGEIFKSSTDTYFRRYNIPDINDSLPFLTSHLTAERFGTRNYFKMSGISYQDLENSADPDTIPVILPVADFQYTSLPLMDNGLYAFSQLNSAIINDRQDFTSDRLSFTQGVRLPAITNFGATFDFIGTVRADAYYVDSGQAGFYNRDPNQSYFTSRIFPSLSVEMGYPLTQTGETVSQVFEPIVMGVFSPNGANDDKIPNYDSILYDFDDTNLFSRNRFSGYDRVESGSRVNYGVKWSVYDRNNRSLSTLFGQTYRLREDSTLNDLMGTDSKFSDYVGRIQMSYKNFSLGYYFRLDNEDFSIKKNEINTSAGNEVLRLGISYIYLKKTQTESSFYPSREEIVLYGSTKLTKDWSLWGSYRYNLAKDGGPVKYTATARYDNECLAVLFDVSRSFTKDRDYKGDTSFMVKFILKTIGGA